ncbi:DUF547 domain-containing protein [Psychromonas sp. SR45-3]|uniref:DUF547 domain-containing protein n=1 Tax=Psychromonas sp. SR45-3 TaxID=2760930 RepID=UPI0015FA0A68|nr:DUF547 domain-containing protein [Psychromonas sp. SR45-3]MBB1274536.1 DUF547 domain-containing protein [Psychromonas sp. SR45-3]
MTSVIVNTTNKVSALVRLTLGAAILSSSLISHVYAETEAKNLHADWTELLQENVAAIDNGQSTAVNYAGFKNQESALQTYLKQLSNTSRVTFDAWPKEKQLAFLINAYNAWTVEFILTEYPDLESIKDLGSLFSSPWDKEFIPLLGKKISLNDIEHGLIRGSDRYNDPRIHFAVNCASIGCPALREEAYTADKLEQQLTQQTERFLTDTSRNYIKGDTYYMSSIFKWYGEDFEKGFRGTQSIQSFIGLYADALTLNVQQALTLKNQDFNVKFLDYNWKLNATK